MEEIVTQQPKRSSRSPLYILLYFVLYFAGIASFLIIIADPFTMNTYFSDNSLLPGLVNREFSLSTEAEYYLRDMEKLRGREIEAGASLANRPALVSFIKNELDNFGLEVYEQNFRFIGQKQSNGTNIYSIIRGERSTSSEAVLLCAPYKTEKNSDTLSSIALSMAMAKYFSSKSYWAKDVIFLFVDHEEHGLSAWLDSYYDVNFKTTLKGRINNHEENSESVYSEPLLDRSGPMQAAIVLELYGKQFTRLDVKIQGLLGQLPNLDLFNLVIELAARESVTPYFHNKSLPFALSQEELYRHHLETALSFMKTQASMKSDGLHGHFLRYAVQSLTLEGPLHLPSKNSRALTASLLNVGRLIEGVFRSLNNLTERFNRSYYFYLILSLRRFTSIGYYMIPFSILITPVLLKAKIICSEKTDQNIFVSKRAILLLASALLMSLLSTINISTAILAAIVSVPVLNII